MSELSVVTIPLKTEIWQEDLLAKRMEIYRSIYNAMLGQVLKRYKKMISDEDYISSKKVIEDTYKITDPKEKNSVKKSQKFKDALEMQRNLFREFGFSEFSFKNESLKYAKHFKDITNTAVVTNTVATQMWRAFDKMIFGDGKMVHFKRYGQLMSLTAPARTGIRIVDENKKTVYAMVPGQDYFCLMSTRKGKNILMPLKIDDRDKYIMQMIQRQIHQVRIVRRDSKGKKRYLVQLIVEGTPYIKLDKNGQEKHPVGAKAVGIYIDTTSITLATHDGIEKIDLTMQSDLMKKKDLQRYMDASRRAMNPDNYNEDGTIKKGRMVNGERVPLTWTYSNGYKKASIELKEIYRKEAEKRMIRANIIANKIIAIGSNIVINDYNFRAASRRKADPELDDKMNYISSKRGGSNIANCAPAGIVAKIDTKLKMRGYEGIKKIRINTDSMIENHREVYAKFLLDKAVK